MYNMILLYTYKKALSMQKLLDKALIVAKVAGRKEGSTKDEFIYYISHTVFVV